MKVEYGDKKEWMTNERTNEQERGIAQTKGEAMPWTEKVIVSTLCIWGFKKGILEIVFPREAEI